MTWQTSNAGTVTIDGQKVDPNGNETVKADPADTIAGCRTAALPERSTKRRPHAERHERLRRIRESNGFDARDRLG